MPMIASLMSVVAAIKKFLMVVKVAKALVV